MASEKRWGRVGIRGGIKRGIRIGWGRGAMEAYQNKVGRRPDQYRPAQCSMRNSYSLHPPTPTYTPSHHTGSCPIIPWLSQAGQTTHAHLNEACPLD